MSLSERGTVTMVEDIHMMEKIGGKASELFAKLLTFLRKLLFVIISAGPIPDHIAFIMDGNRRYAKKLNAALESGHKAGYSSLMGLLANCYDLGVKHVTVFAFSIDNFKRRPEEVSYLMDLMLEKIEALFEQKSIADKYGIRVRFVGNLKLLEERVRVAAERAMRATAHNSGAVLSVCVTYTSCDEIVNAVRESCRERRDEKLVLTGMKLGDLERHMYMAASPDPEIVIRSSGEMRLSNFLLWQTGYCPLYSPEALWPELGLRHLVWAVLNYQRSYSYLEEKKKRNKKEI